MARYARYAPEFRIELDGQPLPPALQAAIVSISYQDGIEGSDRVEVTVANDQLRWLDHPLLQVDTPFTLRIGYAPDPLEKVFVGELTGIMPTFPAGGMPTITLTAQDFLHRLTEGTKDRGFALSLPCIGQFPIPDPVVVSVVSATHLLIPYPDPVGAALSFLALVAAYAVDPLEAKRSIRIQQGESDFSFLRKIAAENGWEMSIDHTMDPIGYILRFRFLIQDYSATMALKWGESLIDFTPRLSTIGQVWGVAARIWIASIKMELVVSLAWDYDRGSFDLRIYPGFGSLDALLGSKIAQKTLTIEGFGPVHTAKNLFAELLPRLNSRQTGTGSCVGDPRIRSGRVIDLQGLGEQFGGLYRVTNATHTLDSSGYRTQFEVRKEVWFGSIPTPRGVDRLIRVGA